MCFHWKSLLRQIRIEGEAEQVSNKEADEYYSSRNYESRIGAWASNQSSIISNRKIVSTEKEATFNQKLPSSLENASNREILLELHESMLGFHKRIETVESSVKEISHHAQNANRRILLQTKPSILVIEPNIVKKND